MAYKNLRTSFLPFLRVRSSQLYASTRADYYYSTYVRTCSTSEFHFRAAPPWGGIKKNVSYGLHSVKVALRMQTMISFGVTEPIQVRGRVHARQETGWRRGETAECERNPATDGVKTKAETKARFRGWIIGFVRSWARRAEEGGADGGAAGRHRVSIFAIPRA